MRYVVLIAPFLFSVDHQNAQCHFIETSKTLLCLQFHLYFRGWLHKWPHFHMKFTVDIPLSNQPPPLPSDLTLHPTMMLLFFFVFICSRTLIAFVHLTVQFSCHLNDSHLIKQCQVAFLRSLNFNMIQLEIGTVFLHVYFCLAHPRTHTHKHFSLDDSSFVVVVVISMPFHILTHIIPNAHFFSL